VRRIEPPTGATEQFREGATVRMQQICRITAAIAALGVAVLSPGFARAQCFNYTITAGSGGVIVPGTADIGNHCDDCYTTFTFPFPILFYADAYTSANIGSNGVIGFTNQALDYENACPLMVRTVHTPFLMPMWDDLFTLDGASGEGIFSAVTGTSPNQTLYLEWRTRYCCAGGAPVTDFEVVFHEGSPQFEIIYGTFDRDDRGGATIGAANGTGRFVQFGACNTPGLITPGLVLSFQCAPPIGRCCTNGNCSLTIQDACTGAGGTWDGAHLDCGNTPYDIIQGTGTMDPGVEDTGNHVDDGLTAITLPFPVIIYGVPFATANVCSNGNLQFVVWDNYAGDYFNECLPFGLVSDPTILAYWDDLVTTDAAQGMGVFTSTTGTAPQRVFNIEWRARHFSNPVGPPNYNFEIRLFEDNSRFQIVFGETVDSGASATIGVQDGSGTMTEFECNTGGANAGVVLSFVPRGGNVCPAACRADLDGNGRLNIQDFWAFLAFYASGNPRADIDGNGQINAQDFHAFLDLYVLGCP
jgi:hypothetical protein